MKSYVILLRGINVGGKNKIRMAELKACLQELGFEDVVTYIQSGNVVLRSNLDAISISAQIEVALLEKFTFESTVIRVLALEDKAFQEVVAKAPEEFGKDNENYRYYVIFLMGVDSSEAMKQIDVRQGIDEAWQGNRVVYYRLPSLTSPDATKSRLSKVSQTHLYQSITIRNWNTTVKLLEILEAHNT